MIFRPRYAALILLATAVAFSTSASAGKFGAPVALSFNGHAATVSVAVDAAGNALAAWADAGMYYGTRPAGGAWSAPQSVYVGGAFPRDARDARRRSNHRLL